MALQDGFVVLVGSDGLGRGDDDLGRLLMHRFLHEVAGASPLPETMLFLNRGVWLVCEDSPALGQLRKLQESGVELRACTTCLDRFGLLDRVAVGHKTDMCDIAGTLCRADKVVSV